MPMAISGDIVQLTDDAFLFAILGDPDDKIWIPKSVVVEGEVEVDDNVELLVKTWWYDDYSARFD